MHQHGLEVNTVNAVLHHWRDYPERSSRSDANYADNRFLALKVAYFVALEYEESARICLWGSGKKGKAIAKLLQEHGIPFHWITNNEKKIGHNIYDIKLREESALSKVEPSKVIIAIAGEKDREYIQTQLFENQHLIPYWFC
jgi:FlaA1/EpsC-like NDP-sugar epimerase